MNASIRGQKRRRQSREQETCALCRRTGSRGFITRGGLRVCWAVPGCMERTLGEEQPYHPQRPYAYGAEFQKFTLHINEVQKLLGQFTLGFNKDSNSN